MKRILMAVVASVAFLAFAAPGMAAPTPSAMATGMMKADKKMDKMGHDSMSSMKSTMKCKPGEKMVKGYTKKDGTKVAGYCRGAKSTKM